jgi:hypothetical protein
MSREKPATSAANIADSLRCNPQLVSLHASFALPGFSWLDIGSGIERD